MKAQNLFKKKILVTLLTASLISACSSSSNNDDSAKLYNVTGSVLGLKGTLVVENNSQQQTTLTLDGDVVMAADIAEGSQYEIRIVNQPDNQFCEVVNGKGSVTQDINNIYIFCNDPHFFAANHTQNLTDSNLELWKTNGTTSGTKQVKDINPAGNSMWQHEVIKTFNGKAYFAADDGTYGRELWRSDGTDAGTVRLTDATSGLGNSNPAYFSILNNKLLFNAFNEVHGYTTSHVMDDAENINILSAFTLQENQDIYQNTLFLENFSLNQSSMVIMSTEGTLLSEHLFNSTYAYDPNRMKVVGDRIFYLSVVGANNTELRTVDIDGTSSPQLITSFDSVDIYNVVNDTRKQTISFKDKFFFNASDGINGHTLWYSDGTGAGTQMLINPDGSSGDSEASALTVMGDRLFFVVNGSSASGLWVTDGTAEGTQHLSSESITLNNMAGDSYPVAAYVKASGTNKQLLFFRAHTAEHGSELWVSDGTVNGTRMVKDIAPGSSGSNPVQFVVRNGYVFFAATGDSQTSTELWRSDGTDEGTYLVKDICEIDHCGGLAGLPPS